MFILDDGIIGAEEFRYDCVSRIAVDNVDILDKAFQSLLNVSNLNQINFNLISIKMKYLDSKIGACFAIYVLHILQCQQNVINILTGYIVFS